jgi:hypothetical protein
MHKQRHYKTSNKKELSRKRKNQKHEYYQIKRINEIYLNIARLNVDEQEIPNDNPGRDSDTKSKKPQNRTYHAHFDPLRLKKITKSHATVQKGMQLISRHSKRSNPFGKISI